MLNAKAFANAAAVVMAIWVVGCALLAYLAPDLLFTLSASWTHAINLEAVRSNVAPNLGSLVLGFVSAVGLTWVTTYGVIWLYNRWVR
ncbi:MAG: DUF5676 family membrane protein [Candidatus Daviesbacteria bacterium]|nr:DUF5676 family membrane protein [Candidatus Daviesbacteria bacterium]